MIFLTALFLLATQFAAASEPEIKVAAPWTVRELKEGGWAFHHMKHPAILILQTEGRPGVTLSYKNRIMHTTLPNDSIPLLSPPFQSEDISKTSVESQGIDLVIRLEGPSLREWTEDESAPEDAVLSWIRVRVRGRSIRFAMKGVQQWTLPVSQEGPFPISDPQGGISFDHGFGHWRYQTEALGIRGQKSREVWFIDTSPSIELMGPYPNTVLDWTPIPEPQRP